VKPSRTTNQIRIIGGTHRGRRIEFPDLPGLRPTGDRIRETLFNWLQPILPGAACLDLFAGSGALGLEAASRGAGRVVFLEQAPQAAAHIRKAISLLRLADVEVQQVDTITWLDRPGVPFHILFLDPPFADARYGEVCRLLHERGWLAPQARIYIEADKALDLGALPEGWDCVREKTTGQVAYRLFVAP